MTEEARVVVGYSVDKASVDAAVQMNTRVTSSYKDVKAAADQLGISVSELAARTNIKVVGSGEQLVATNIQVAASYDRITDSAKRAAVAAAFASIAPTGEVASSSGFSLASARSLAGGAGGVLATVGGGQAGSAVASILALTSVLGPAGAVAGVATVAYSALRAEIEANAQVAKEAANALKGRAGLVAGGATTEDVEAQKKRLETANQVVANQFDTLLKYNDKLRGIIPDPTSESAARVRQALTGDDKIFEGMQSLFNEISDLVGIPVRTMTELDQVMTEVKNTSKGFTDEIGSLNRLLGSGELDVNNAAAAWEKLTGQLADGTNRLSTAVSEALDGVKVKAEALTAQNNVLLDGVTREVEARQQLFESGQKFIEIELAASDKARAAKLNAEARTTEAVTQAAERRTEITTQAEDAINRVLRDSGRSHVDAVRRRDVVADLVQKEHATDALADQKLALSRQLATVDTGLEKTERVIKESYHTQLTTIADSTRAQVAVVRDSQARINTDILSAVNTQALIVNNGWANVNTITQNWMRTIAEGARASLGGIGGTGTIPGGIGGGIGGLFGKAAFDKAVNAQVRTVLGQVFP